MPIRRREANNRAMDSPTINKGAAVAHSSRRRRGPIKTSPSPHEQILTIDYVGHRGDGVARDGDKSVFVSGTLAGETVRAEVSGERGRAIELLRTAPERTDPFCPYFGACGGCTSQHMTDAAYAHWKQGIVEAALRHRGLSAVIDPLLDAHGLGRRRATFHARRAGTGWTVGYAEARSHRIVDLETCPVLARGLASAPTIMRQLASLIPRIDRFDAQLTETDSGIDVHLIGIPEPDLAGRAALAGIADRLDLARIAIDGETILERRSPRIVMGQAVVAPPPSAFLQATATGESALAHLVSTHLGAARRIADLFCGLGPFALRLAAGAAVYAADSQPTAIAALTRAARAAPKLRPIQAEVRDLFARPLQGAELDRFDGVVFDPPRAGAEAQARALALAHVPFVVSVSCDAATFARDAAILTGGGYRLERVAPIDQFKWSPHIEIVGLFRGGV